MSKDWVYYINDMWFEMPVKDGFEIFYADIRVTANQSEFGTDADGNRGIWITEREAEVEQLRDSNGEVIPITDEVRNYIQGLVEERGCDLA
ncbi:MAG: hypothetical protein ACOC1K_05685 [Nanoarchaeota archaeon]